MLRLVAFLLAGLFLAAPLQAQLTPQEAITMMGRGINLGNTLEPPTEGAWNNGPAQEHYFDDFKAAGFSTVRIPVRWDQHTETVPPYTVDATWLARVEEVVDWALARDFFVIINAHHEDWLKQNYDDAGLRDRFDSIWRQVAEHFRDKPEKLFFEIINEPYGMNKEQVDDLNARILSIIRESNPSRIVIFSGHGWANAEQLVQAAIPDDDYLMAYYHSYDPWTFAGMGQGSWGTEADRNAVAAKFQLVADWSAAHGIPVMISEFGAVRATPFNDRMAFYAAYVDGAVAHGMAFMVWDDGGDFHIYDRKWRTWSEEKDILIHGYPDSPTRLAFTSTVDTLVTLTWVNRAEGATHLTVERRTIDGVFAPLAELPPDATAFSDNTAEGGQTYQYRIIAHSGGVDRYSYPIQTTVTPTARSSYPAGPHPLPGTLEAEDFDEGGEGLTYHDTDAENIPGAYRPGVGVDIAARDDGGYQVTHIASGEWLEYTVDVAEAGLYEVTVYVASVGGGGRLRVVAGGEQTSILNPIATGSDQALAPLSGTLSLAAGPQIIRLSLLTGAAYHVDRMEFRLVGATSTEDAPPAPAITVYPNPATTYVHVVAPAAPRQVLSLYNVLGQRVRHLTLAGPETRLDLDGLPPGVYLLRLERDGRPATRHILVKH
ncbi:MAG: hypothetical protein KatS3mg042_0097 [Rhodothermaceae bacterium]|nr:MAG: hypothetical protein KatS3mg042_0097 [Rhodothermaceae bacterium]